MNYYYSNGKFVPITPINYALEQELDINIMNQKTKQLHEKNIENITKNLPRNNPRKSSFLPYLTKKPKTILQENYYYENSLADSETDFQLGFKGKIYQKKKQFIENDFLLNDDLTMRKTDRQLVNSRNGENGYIQQSFYPTVTSKNKFHRRQVASKINLAFQASDDKK